MQTVMTLNENWLNCWENAAASPARNHRLLSFILGNPTVFLKGRLKEIEFWHVKPGFQKACIFGISFQYTQSLPEAFLMHFPGCRGLGEPPTWGWDFHNTCICPCRCLHENQLVRSGAVGLLCLNFTNMATIKISRVHYFPSSEILSLNHARDKEQYRPEGHWERQDMLGWACGEKGTPMSHWEWYSWAPVWFLTGKILSLCLSLSLSLGISTSKKIGSKEFWSQLDSEEEGSKVDETALCLFVPLCQDTSQMYLALIYAILLNLPFGWQFFVLFSLCTAAMILQGCNILHLPLLIVLCLPDMQFSILKSPLYSLNPVILEASSKMITIPHWLLKDNFFLVSCFNCSMNTSNEWATAGFCLPFSQWQFCSKYELNPL